MPACRRNQYVRLILRVGGSLVPLLLEGAAPASLALPDAFHSPSARAGTKPLGWRSPLFGEALVAAGTVATVVEKSLERLPSLPLEVPLPVGFVFGCGRARGTAGSARCVSLCRPPSPGISAGPSSASTFLLPHGTHGCNSVRALAAGGTAARILSADMGGFAAGAPAASVRRHTRDGPTGVYNPREGPWEVKAPRSSCSGEDSTPLRSDSGHPVQRNLNTYRKARFSGFPSSWVRLVSWSGSRHSSHLAGAFAAIMWWHRGPSWRCHFGPFAHCHQQPGVT
jgi:hypothetical protein